MGSYYLTMNVPDSLGDGMVFASLEEVETAYAARKVGTDARIKVRLPMDRCLREDRGNPKKLGARIDTTVGRVIFNKILPKGMPFYDVALKSSELAKVISDCYEFVGRRATIELLDDMNQPPWIPRDPSLG